MDLQTIQELYLHQQWADTRILEAIRAHPPAAQDEDMRTRLNHIGGVHRGFLSLFLAKPFDAASEMRVPETLDEIERRFSEAHTRGFQFVQSLDDADLGRPMDMPWISGLRLTVGQALLQVVMHSQHHRAQCSMRLRQLGGSPPIVDYIMWLKDRQDKAAQAH
jgi:uncharacterized damage-inducible protein DinB